MLIDTTGRHATGRVQALGCDSDGMGINNYWVRIEYACDGYVVTAKVMLSQREQQRYEAGQRVGLTYAVSRPGIVRLDPPEWRVPQAA